VWIWTAVERGDQHDRPALDRDGLRLERGELVVGGPVRAHLRDPCVEIAVAGVGGFGDGGGGLDGCDGFGMSAHTYCSSVNVLTRGEYGSGRSEARPVSIEDQSWSVSPYGFGGGWMRARGGLKSGDRVGERNCRDFKGLAMIPVVALIRVSTPGQAKDDRGGIDGQRDEVDQVVRRYGLTVVESVEVVISGTSVERSASWYQVMRLVESGAVAGVAAAKVDRLTRPIGYGSPELEDLRLAGCPLYTLEGVHDHLGSSILTTSVRAAVAADERRRIMERAIGGKKALRKRGRWTESPKKLPMGVRWDRREGWSYTGEIAVVVELHERVASGQGSIQSIARSLGIPYGVAKVALSHPLYRGQLEPATFSLGKLSRGSIWQSDEAWCRFRR
jgi:DNA invertase Pin-like site-specific DNA recombinase